MTTTQMPLAAMLRPERFDQIIGQDKIISQMELYKQAGKMPSLLFWGPPGSGKTTLATVISKELDADFVQLSGVSSKKADLENIIELAQQNKGYNKKTIIFLDEIHRRNKSQQDALLPHVENGTIILIGATTETPSFSINNALLSRCKVLVFEQHTQENIAQFIKNNKETIKNAFPGRGVDEEAISLIAQLANGDLRSAINILESALLIKTEGNIDPETILTAFDKPVYYDRDGEEHYNIISAVHKSLRDGDADAACYRIQRMLVGGEDPLYICRRLIRFASEDIGPADNNALLLANQTYDACAKIGMPECDVIIFQLALYLAKAKKSNICYIISQETKQDIAKFGNLPVPMHIRNASSKLMKDLGYGSGYKYAHDFPDTKISQEHFPDKLQGRKYGKK